jgi:hypothetical protein
MIPMHFDKQSMELVRAKLPNLASNSESEVNPSAFNAKSSPNWQSSGWASPQPFAHQKTPPEGGSWIGWLGHPGRAFLSAARAPKWGFTPDTCRTKRLAIRWASTVRDFQRCVGFQLFCYDDLIPDSIP